MGITEIIKTLVTVLPLIEEVVQLVEKLFPKAGSGAQKLEHALNIVQSVLPQVGVAADQISALAGPLKATISAVASASTPSSATPAIQQPAVATTVG